MKETKSQIMSNVKDAVTSKVIANNTVKYTTADGREVIRLHQTDIITKWPNGDITLNSGGWKTVTTKDRINAFSPIRIVQKKGIWYTDDGSVFFDGITFDAEKKCTNAFDEYEKEVLDTQKNTLKKIDAFISAMKKLDEFPKPSTGDCWYCMMKTSEGKVLGDAMGDTEHLMSHLDEKYIHGSLILNALRHIGYKDHQIGFVFGMKDIGYRAVRRYFKSKLGING